MSSLLFFLDDEPGFGRRGIFLASHSCAPEQTGASIILRSGLAAQSDAVQVNNS